MVNKKAYLKTLEAVMAIAIFLIFLVTALVVNQPWDDKKIVPDDIKLIQDTILNKVGSDEVLRYKLVSGGVDDTEEDARERITASLNLENLVPNTLHSLLQVCWAETCPIPEETTFSGEDPEYTKKTIYADSLIIQHPNYIEGTSQIAVLRLFLWRKLE
jgi:hypothetical protein